MGQSFSNLRVMVCDNSEAHRNLVMQILFSCGIKNVRGTPAETDATNPLNEQPFDLVIGRLSLNDPSFLKVVKWLRTPEATANAGIPILTSITTTDRKLLIVAIKAGVDMLLAEPLTTNDMKRRIEALINSPLPRITTPTYIGPDRRRTPGNQEVYTGPERRKAKG